MQVRLPEYLLWPLKGQQQHRHGHISIWQEERDRGKVREHLGEVAASEHNLIHEKKQLCGFAWHKTEQKMVPASMRIQQYMK